MKPFKISMWPNAKATSEGQRKDIEINNLTDLYSLFCKNIKPVVNKIDQKIITRRRQQTRARDNDNWKPPYLITLDYDSVDENPEEVHGKLKDLKINHFIFTTWTHKTVETPQKKNNGKNCFKVMLELNSPDEKDLVRLTNGLGALVGKTDIKKVDDISSGIFLGGAHPDFIDEFDAWHFNSGMSEDDTRLVLLDNVPKVEEVKKDPMTDFEMWDRTAGQKWTAERLTRALKTIKYEEVEGFSKMAIWYSLGYALHSTQDDDNFELWDEWCLENCGEDGTYNREENENFWAKKSAPDNHKSLCTLSTLWHLEKLFKAKESKSEIKQSSWSFFSTLAEEEPEPIKFLINDLLVENSIGFLVGSGGVGKSSLCLEIAKAISSGGHFFGDEKHKAMQGTVAIINKEDSINKIHNQIHNLVDLDMERATRGASSDFAEFASEEIILNMERATRGASSDFAEFASEEIILNKVQVQEIKDRWLNVARPQWAQSTIRLSNADGEDLDSLGAIKASLKSLQEELLETKRPPLKLIIFDPLNLWHGGDQNSQRDMSFIFSAFQQIQRDLDTAVLIVHHKNKSNGFSGSHTIRDSGRFMWDLRPKMIGKEPSDKFIELYVDKNNDAKANYTVFDFIRTEKGLLDIANIDVEGGE